MRLAAVFVTANELLAQPAPACAGRGRGCTDYALLGHGDLFLDELDAVFEVIQAMPLRFPIAYGTVHRALLRRYPFAVFFRIRPKTEHVVVLAVFPQRGDPDRWPKR